MIAFLRNAFRAQSKDENGKIIFKLKSNHFSFEEILKFELPSRKSLYITEIELDNFMSYRKGASSFFVLSLLYPNLKYKEVQFHQDHIHPASKFDVDNFNKIGLSKEMQDEWLKLRDTVPNLQLLEGRQNESKNATAFKVWLDKKDESVRTYFKISNFIPEDISLDFLDFLEFYEKRKSVLIEELKKVLAINNNAQLTNQEYLEKETIADED